MSDDELNPERAELLTLRARMVVARTSCPSCSEAMHLIRPEQLTLFWSATRKGLRKATLTRLSQLTCTAR